jgi:hypothetical protein
MIVGKETHVKQQKREQDKPRFKEAKAQDVRKATQQVIKDYAKALKYLATR